MSETLSFAEARENPCLGCGAPCCTVLPLYDFSVTSLANIDYLLYCLNFDRIEAAVMEGGTWRLHYRAPCRHLDLDTRLCGLHGTPDKPAICRNYSPYSCYYKRIFKASDYRKTVRMDRRRVLAWADRCQFNEHRDLIAMPSVESLLDWLPPMEEPPETPVPPSPVLEASAALARGESAPPPAERRSWSQANAPCQGCEAWCCQRLSFQHSGPVNAANIDHIRFALGFPGVELCVDNAGNWMLEVRTTCRHLLPEPDASGHRCGVFGTAERPSTCDTLDGHFCAYRGRYSRPDSHWSVRVTHATFPAVASLYTFDQGGAVVHKPDTQTLRLAVEQAWRDGAPVY